MWKLRFPALRAQAEVLQVKLTTTYPLCGAEWAAACRLDIDERMYTWHALPPAVFLVTLSIPQRARGCCCSSRNVTFTVAGTTEPSARVR